MASGFSTSRFFAHKSALAKSLRLFMAGVFTLSSLNLQSVFAQQITDPTAPIQFRPSVGTSPRGVPVIGITTPSFGGVSHNKFQRYDVDTRGVILNNSGVGGTSVLGGALPANPNIVGRKPASVIVNEVTGTSASTLNGPTEVFGGRADVVIANPNGVGCVGCSFINSGKVTLTTGVPSPNYDTGAITYAVRTGTVSVTGSGLAGGNGESLGDIDLIGRQLQVFAPVSATGKMRLRAGAVDYDALNDVAIAVTTGVAPVTGLAVNATSAGTLTAGSISVLSKDLNLGVVLDGDIAALSGSIAVKSAGDLRLAKTTTTNDLKLEADGTTIITGQNRALGRITVQANRVDFALGSELTANDAIVVETLQDLTSKGILRSGQTVSLSSGGQLIAEGQILATGQVVLEGANIKTSNLGIGAASIVIAGLGLVQLDETKLVSSSTISVSGNEIDLGQGTAFKAPGTIQLDARDRLNNATLLDYATLDLIARNHYYNTATGGLVQDSLLLTTRDDIVNEGLIYGRISTALATRDMENRLTGVVYGPEVAINLGGNLTNLGKILSDSTLQIVAVGDVLNDGSIRAGTDLTLRSASYRANNAAALVEANNISMLVTGALENSGKIIGANLLGISAGSLTNNGTASVIAARVANLQVGGDIRNDGQIGGIDQLLVVAAGNVANSGDMLSSRGTLEVLAGGALTSSGRLVAATDMHLAALSYEGSSVNSVIWANNISLEFNNTLQNKGLIEAVNLLDIRSGGSISNDVALAGTNQGTIRATMLNILTGGDLINAGAIEARDSFVISVAGNVDNSGRIITNTVNQIAGSGQYANNGTLLVAGLLNNTGLIAVDESLNLRAASYTGGVNSVVYARNADVRFTGNFYNQGKVIANELLTFVSADLSNIGANSALYGGFAQIIANGNVINEGAIAGKYGMDMLVQGNVHSPGHISSSDGALTLVAGGAITSSGDLLALTRLNVQAASYESLNASTRLGAEKTAFALTNDFTNRGTIVASDRFDLSARHFVNGAGSTTASLKSGLTTINLTGDFTNDGTLVSIADLTLHATGAGNNTGKILGAANANIALGGMLTNNGEMRFSETLVMSAASYLASNAAASVAANVADLRIAGSVDNAGLILGAQKLDLVAGGDLVNRGVNALIESKNMVLTIAGMGQNDGQILARDGMQLAFGGALTSPGHISVSNGSLDLSAGGVVTSGGDILAQNDVNIRSKGYASSSTASRLGGQNLTLTLAEDFFNQGQVVAVNNLSLTARDVTQTAGARMDATALTISATRDLNNAGLMRAQENFTIAALGQANNSGLIYSGNTGALNVTGALNNDGSIVTVGNLQLAAAQYLGGVNSNLSAAQLNIALPGAFSTAGQVTGRLSLDLSATDVSLTSTTAVLAGGKTTINASGNLSNLGQVYALNDLSVMLQGNVYSPGSLVAENGNLKLNAGGNIQAGGDIAAGQNLTMTGASYAALSAQNRILGNDVTLRMVGGFDTLGLVSAQGTLDLAASSLSNGALLAGTSAGVISGKKIVVALTGDANNQGLIQSLTDLNLTAQGKFGNTGAVYANDNAILAITGALTNDGTLAAGNQFALNAGSYLANNTTSLLSARDTNLTVSGSIDNAGRIIGQDVLTLASASLTNRGTSALLAGGNVTATIANFVVNDGLILAENNLGLTAGGNITSNGSLMARSGNLQLTTPGAVALSGDMLAASALTMNAGSYAGAQSARMVANNINGQIAGTFDNAGLVQATNAVALNASSLNNGAQGFINGNLVTLNLSNQLSNAGYVQSGTDLVATAANANNTGTMLAGRNALFTLSNALNNDGAIGAGNLLDIQAGSYTATLNTASLVAKNINLGLTSDFDNAGSVTAEKNIYLSARDIKNSTTGSLSALNIIGTASRDFLNDGAFKASDTLDLSIAGAAGNTGKLYAGNELYAFAGRNFTNSGLISGARVAALKSADFNNLSGAEVSSNITTLLATGAINNAGTMSGTQYLGLKGTDLTLGGTAGAPAYAIGGFLNIDLTGALTLNTNALLQTESSAIIKAATANDNLFKGMTITEGLFNYGKNLDVTLTQGGATIAKDLILEGSLNLTTAGDLVNQKTIAAAGNMALTSTAGSIINGKDNAPNPGGGTIYGAQDVTLIAATDVRNYASVIQSLGNLNISAGNNVLNERPEYRLYYNHIYFDNGSEVYARVPFAGQYIYANPATIQASNNINISAGNEINNIASNIIADGSINLSAAKINNKQVVWFVPTGGYFSNAIRALYQSDALISAYNSVNLNGSISVNNSGTVHANTAIVTAPSVSVGLTNPNATTPISRQPNPTIDLANYLSPTGPAVIAPNATATDKLSVGRIGFGGTIAPVALGGVSGGADTSLLIGGGPARQIGLIGTPTPVQTARVADLGHAPENVGAVTQSINFPTFLTVVPNPDAPGSLSTGSVNYLHQAPIAGGPAQRNPSYILQGVGDTRSNLTFFADPNTEQRLIQAALTEQTGRTLIDPSYRNATQQQEALYQGTVDFLKANPQIQLGDKLTAEQQASLTKPIIWYENKIIDGRQVLTPQLLLPQDLLANLTTRPEGSFDAKNILISGDHVYNSGSILADQKLIIEAGDFLNERRVMRSSNCSENGACPTILTVQSGGNLVGDEIFISTERDLINRGGMIAGTSLVDMLSTSGNIINEAARGNSLVDLGKGKSSLKPELFAGSISSGGELKIAALQGSYRNTASDIGAFGDVNIFVKDNITIEAVAENYLSAYDKSTNDFGKTEKTFTVTPLLFDSHIRSLMGDINLVTDGDLEMKGGQLRTDFGDIHLAADDIRLETVSSEGFQYSKSTSIGLSGYSRNSSNSNNFIYAQPTLMAGGDIQIIANSDVYGRGANLAAQHDLAVFAEDSIKFDAHQETRYLIQKALSIGLTYPGSTLVKAIESGGSLLDIGKAFISQDPLGAAIVGLAGAKTTGSQIGGSVRVAMNLVGLFSQGSNGGANMQSVLSDPASLSSLATNLGERLNKNFNPLMGFTAPEKPTGTADGASSATSGNGFPLSGTFGVSFSQSTSKNFWSESRISNLTAGNDLMLSVGNGELALLGGTQVTAGRDITLAAESMRVEALHDWTWNSSKTIGGSASISSQSINLSANYSQQKGSSDSYTAAGVHAGGNLSVTTLDDLTLRGASLTGKTIDVNVGGNLMLESLQNASQQKGFNISGGISIQNGIPLPSSFAYGQNKSSSLWTSAISEIVGEGLTNINVGNHTSLVGATLYSKSDNLNFSTGTLSLANLHDFSKANSWNVGISGMENMFQQAGIGAPKGGANNSATGNNLLGGIQFGFATKDKQGETFSVIGNGTIKVGGEENPAILQTVHRSIDGRQIVTVNHSSGFDIDIPIINGTVLTNQLSQINNFFAAVNAQIPPEVASQGPASADYYRRLIALGLSPSQAALKLDEPDIRASIEKNQNWRLAVEAAGGDPVAVPAAVKLAISKGIKLNFEDGMPSIDGAGCETGPGCIFYLSSKGITTSPETLKAEATKLVSNAAETIKENLSEFVTLAKSSALFLTEDDALRLATLKAKLDSAMLEYNLCGDIAGAQSLRTLLSANYPSTGIAGTIIGKLISGAEQATANEELARSGRTIPLFNPDTAIASGSKAFVNTFVGLVVGSYELTQFVNAMATNPEAREKMVALIADVRANPAAYSREYGEDFYNFMAENGTKLLNGDADTWGSLVGTLAGGLGLGKAAKMGGEAASTGLKIFASDAEAMFTNANLFGGKFVYDSASKSWLSPSGLVFEPDATFGNRILHAMEHLYPNPNKINHTVFNVGRSELLPLIDEAWTTVQSLGLKSLPNDGRAFVVPMNRSIGTNGETSIRLIVDPVTNKFVTAYPVK